MCALKRQRDEHGSPTLGIFKPAVIEKLIIKPTAPQWTQEELEIMRQGDLFESEERGRAARKVIQYAARKVIQSEGGSFYAVP
jgi:hypothetical protein